MSHPHQHEVKSFYLYMIGFGIFITGLIAGMGISEPTPLTLYEIETAEAVARLERSCGEFESEE